MNDADRSKAQLIDELRSTRQLLAELEGADRALRSLTHACGERVKELNCLYGISHLVETPGISLPQILQGTAELIPPSWQFPDITVARITLDDWDYHTEGFQQGLAWRQTAKIMIEGQVRGAVEVRYVEERPESREGPFLKEERSLIDAIAERLGRVAERTWAAEQLAASEERFKAQYKGLPIPVYTWQRAGDDFVLVDFNDAAEEATQGSVASLLGSSAGELYADAPDIVEDLQRCLTERRSFKREMLYRYRTMNRSRRLWTDSGGNNSPHPT